MLKYRFEAANVLYTSLKIEAQIKKVLQGHLGSSVG